MILRPLKVYHSRMLRSGIKIKIEPTIYHACCFSTHPSRLRETGCGIAEHGAVIDPKCFDPALLSERQRDEETKLDQLGNREVSVQLLPQAVVGDIGVPRDRTGVGQRDFLSLAEFVRFGKVEQLIVLRFSEALPSSLDGALHASILALNGFGDIDTA
jgi:hypothetical protein